MDYAYSCSMLYLLVLVLSIGLSDELFLYNYPITHILHADVQYYHHNSIRIKTTAVY